jgi:metal-responsive CopG/Arc/MetJ family transcriptional regulator
MQTKEEEILAVQVRAPKSEIDKLCENTLTDVRSQAIMIAVRTYNQQKAKEVA